MGNDTQRMERGDRLTVIPASSRSSVDRIRTSPVSLGVALALIFTLMPLAGPAAAADQPIAANLATTGTATQSSTLNAGTGANKGIDRLVSGFTAQGAMARTASGNEQYWQLDLGAVRSVSQLKLWEGIDASSGNDLRDFSVLVSPNPMTNPSLGATRNQSGVTEIVHSGQVAHSIVFDVGVQARYVRVQLHGSDILSLAEVAVLGGGSEFNEIAPNPMPTWGASGINGSITIDIEAEIFAIEQIGRTLFVGGRFNKPLQRRTGTSVDQPYLMALDAQTGAFLSWFRPKLTGAVLALEASPDGSRLFVGGEFYSVDDHAATSGLVALDPRTGHVDPTWTTSIERRFAPGPPTVKNLEVVENHLYAIGSFNAVRDAAGTRRGSDNVARFSLSTGAYDSGWRPRINGGSGYGIAVDATRGVAYLTGTFTSANGDGTLGNFAAVDLATGANIVGQPRYPFNSGQYRETFDVVAHGDLVFVGGSQHILSAIDPDSTGATYDVINQIYTNGGGGDIQDIELVGDRIYASCHCRADIWDENQTGSRIYEGNVRGVFAVDANTGDFVDAFPAGFVDWSLSAGPWALHGGADSCLWVGGDINPTSGGQYPVSLGRLCPENGPASTGLAAPSQRTADNTPPSPPGRPSLSLTGDDVVLSWAAASDSRGIPSYAVRRDGKVVAKTRQRTHRLYDEPGGAHSYTIVALDPADNASSPSQERTITVPPDPGAFRRFVNADFDSWLAGQELSPFTFVSDLENATGIGGGQPVPYPAGRFFGGYSPGGMPDDDGGLIARIGGDIDPGVVYYDQAGGYQTTISLAAATPVSIEFDYRFSTGRTMEDVAVAVWVDGQQRSPSGNGYIEIQQTQYNGPWEHVAYELGNLSAGTHDIVIGLRLDDQWRNILDRFATLAFDDVVIADARPGVELISPGEGNEISGTQLFSIAAQDHLTSSASLAVHLSIDGGSSWLPTTLSNGRFTRSINTTSLPDGDLDVQVRALDDDGRQTIVQATVIVDNDQGVGELAASQGASVVWRLDEMGSGVAGDLVGDVDGTYVGNPQRGVVSPVNGSGRAVRFDGVNDGVRIPRSELIDGRISDAATVELWFSADNVGKRGVLYEQGSENRGMSVYVEGGRLYAGAWNTAADAGLDVPWTSGPAFLSKAIGNGGLHHVALVHDAGAVTAYLDGQAMGRVRGTGRLFPDTGLTSLGHARGGTRFHSGPVAGVGSFFDGLLDEVAIHGTALGPAVVQQHNSAGR